MTEKRFLTLLKTQVMSQKSCFLLRNLLIGITDMYEKYGFEVELTRTKDLKKLITETFPKEIRFNLALGLHGSPMIFHATDVSLTDYALASLVEAGVRDTETTVAFARKINWKIKARETKMKFPASLQTLIEKLDTYKPVKDIFNVISYLVDRRWKDNVQSYACPYSDSLAKIWHIADPCQRLGVVGDNPQSIALSKIHRMTGCKETTNVLSRAGFGSSYANVCQETKKLADDGGYDSSFALATIPKGQPTHVTIDNSDGRQQTLTRLEAIHDTKSTIYVPKLVTHPAEDTNAESFTENICVEFSRKIQSPSLHDISNEHTSKVHLFRERDNTESYRIGTRSELPSLKDNNID